MPWPIKPAPITAIRARANSAVMAAPSARSSACRIAAIGVKNMAGVKIRSLGGEEQQRPRQVRRLAKTAFRHAGKKAFAHRGGALVVLVHPGRQRRTENRRPNGIDGDAGVAPLAAERLGDAIDSRLRCAIRGVTGGMT